MKKVLSVIFIFFFLFFVFSLGSFAYSEDDAKREIEDYLNEFSLIIPKDSGVDINDTDGLLENIGFGYVINELFSSLNGKGSSTYEFLFLSLSLSLFTALAYAFSGDAVGRGAGAVSVSAIFVFILPSCLFAIQSLGDASEFFSYAIPIMSAVSVAGGSTAQASVQGLALNAGLWLIGEGVVKVLLPLSLFLCVLSLFSSLSKNNVFDISKNARGIFLWGMGALTALFSGALGLQSILSGAKDSMSIRTAKYAISNMIPIVGASVSGALSTLGGALSYVKDTLGIGTVAVLLSLLLPTLITLLIYRVILFVSSSLVKLVSGRDKNAFSSLLFAFDTLIASYAFSALIYIIQTVIFIKSGVAIL